MTAFTIVIHKVTYVDPVGEGAMVVPAPLK